MVVIEAHGLTKRFGPLVAVDNVSVTLAEGEVLGFLGPNGAGKTTTIRMLAGIISPDSGYAIIAGRRTDGELEQIHEVVGLLTEHPGFYDRLSARRNLEFFAGFYSGINAAAQVDKYLKVMGLWERRDSKVGTFSKGMKQRLALARTLLHEPRVLFLDEPTAGLDPEAAQDVRRLITDLSHEGRTIFMSTHNLAEAESLCHRIAVIRTRLLALDTGEGLRRRFFRRQVVVQLETLSGPVTAVVKGLTFVDSVREDGNQLTVELTDPERNRPELVKAIVEAGGRVIGVAEKQYPLEEVYLKLVHEETGHEPPAH
ncbi:MAG: ABC transporter ATP-binding protein [Dehalococcoidales bacterium]|nr:ABC transporter ATP-binding protein [Dehalococcoidales bacterium]